MDTKAMMKMIEFITAIQEDYEMIICTRKRENAEGTTVMMQGKPDELMFIMAQQVASFYKRFKDCMKEGVDIEKICSDLCKGAQYIYDQWEKGEADVADMSGMMGCF